MTKEKVIIAWSGGKDSSMALYTIRQNPQYEIMALLTTVSEAYDRISMHGVRRSLLERQAEALGLPLEIVRIAASATNEEYESRMREALTKYQAQGVTAVVFGDIFLEDLRRYREEKLKEVGLAGIFPLWRRDTVGLAREFIALGFKARITCVDSNALDQGFVGRDFDAQFLADIPAQVDPCGENGEFHSFTYAAPIFRESVACQRGEVVFRENRFYFCDLVGL